MKDTDLRCIEKLFIGAALFALVFIVVALFYEEPIKRTIPDIDHTKVEKRIEVPSKKRVLY